MDLVLTLGDISAVARLDPASAPKTCAALGSELPFSATVHLAKIAGQEFYMHVPLFLEVEHRKQVAELTEGTIAFWPERQLLCVYYGSIQQEDATVTALGTVTENLSGLAEAAESLRSQLGRVIALVHLSRRDVAVSPPSSDVARQGRGLGQAVYGAYHAIRQTVPADVRALMARRGAMQPAGPLICGEGETRKLHELAWLVRAEILATGRVPAFVGQALEQFAGRLAGWYGLPQAGALVHAVAAALPGMRDDQARELVEGLILYIGRLSLWLDACIPWDGINRLLHQAPPALDGPPARDAGRRNRP